MQRRVVVRTEDWTMGVSRNAGRRGFLGNAVPVLLAAASWCVAVAPSAAPAAGGVAGARIEAVAVGDKCVVRVEVADEPLERHLGLMYRRRLPEGHGMLFVFEYSKPLVFWMKNTYIPLDIAFIDDKMRICNIETMKPLDDTLRYRSRRPCRYALEVPAGYFERHGVRAGDRVEFLGCISASSR